MPHNNIVGILRKEGLSGMRPWLLHSFIALGLWGFWGFLGKVASRSVASRNLLLLSSIGSLLVFPIFLAIFHKHFRFIWHDADYYYAIIGGTAGALGGLFFYWAISRGEASRVVIVTAMYPIVTVILAWFFLKEPLTIQKIAGIVFAVLGICLLTR